MSGYTAGQVERAAGSMRVRSSDELEVERMLRAYAATLRQQAEQAGVGVSDAVVERATRDKFETWIQSTRGWAACKQRGKPFSLWQTVNGDYRDYRVNDRWYAWQAATRSAGEVA